MSFLYRGSILAVHRIVSSLPNENNVKYARHKSNRSQKYYLRDSNNNVTDDPNQNNAITYCHHAYVYLYKIYMFLMMCNNSPRGEEAEPVAII